MKKIILIIILYMSISNTSDSPILSAHLRADSYERAKNEYLYDLEFECFVNHLGLKESNNNWKIVSTSNCIGEWQFSYSTLEYLGYGYITPERFRNNPNIFPRYLQKQVLRELIDINIGSLVPYEKYIGKTINHVKITRAGLLAGLHLGGIVSVKNFLISHGVIDPKDLYGTKTSDYIKEFGIYKL